MQCMTAFQEACQIALGPCDGPMYMLRREFGLREERELPYPIRKVDVGPCLRVFTRSGTIEAFHRRCADLWQHCALVKFAHEL